MSKYFKFQSEEDFQKASAEFGKQLKDLLKHDCDSNRKDACHQLGQFYQSIEHDHDTAAEIFKENCDKRGYMQSCFNFGVYQLLREEKNPKDALRYFNIACEGDVQGACNNAALVYQDGMLPDVEQDLDKAVKLFEGCCDKKFKNGCFNLSTLYLQGKGNLPKDMEKAFQYSKKSCDLGHSWGCINTGIMYSKGEGVEANEELAKKYKEQGKKLEGLGADQ